MSVLAVSVLGLLDERKGWKRVLQRIDRGEADGIVMHVDTLRLLKDAEWDELKELGLAVGVFKRVKTSTA